MTCFFHPFSDEITMGEQDRLSAHKRLYQVHPQGENKKRLSARFYEYFVNRFSQRIVCIQDDVDLGKDYKEKCHIHLKKNFTYFRRGESFAFSIDTDNEVNGNKIEDDGQVTLQITDPLLRFLDWVAARKVDVFILSHIDVILKHKASSGLTLSTSSYIENELCSSISGMTLYPNTSTHIMHTRSRTHKLKQLDISTRWHLPANGNDVFRIRIGQS